MPTIGTVVGAFRPRSTNWWQHAAYQSIDAVNSTDSLKHGIVVRVPARSQYRFPSFDKFVPNSLIIGILGLTEQRLRH